MNKRISALSAICCIILLVVVSAPNAGGLAKSGIEAEGTLIEGQIMFTETDGTVTVKTTKDLRIIYITEDTKIQKDSVPVKFDDIKRGNQIRVKVDGMRKAIEVQILSEKGK